MLHMTHLFNIHNLLLTGFRLTWILGCENIQCSTIVGCDVEIYLRRGEQKNGEESIGGEEGRGEKGWMYGFYVLYFHTREGLIGQPGTMTMR